MSLIQKLGKDFVITTELGPVKGALFKDSLDKAREYLALDAINIHDCPMGNLRINSIAMAHVIQSELGVESIPHFTCRDRSLLGTQADLLGAHALGIRYVLVTTGDPPKHGPYPSKPVYDYNVFELINLIKKMNSGLDYNDKEFGGNTDFNISCTALPTARDIDQELKKMERKIKAGADFFQTQVVYDAERTITFINSAKVLGKPILIGIMPLKSLKMARYMKEKVEGIDVPDEIISRMEKEGVSGIQIVCDVIRDIYEYVDGIHIMALGDVKGTNQIIEYVKGLSSGTSVARS
nr:5,10-methylenetetrahydrofolate reductase [Desulfobacterales bacterium]